MPPIGVALKRILRDVSEVTNKNKDILAKAGIFYLPDESDVSHGYALLIGQKDTPYYGGFYFFDIRFPNDYPFSPLKVRTLTQDGKTRFNPNMYIEGKVCLSILNTWHDGPQWSGVQTLESVLLIIMSDVLHSNPLINEPAYKNYIKESIECLIYNRMIFHANLHTSIYAQLSNLKEYSKGFQHIMNEYFLENRESILEKVKEYFEFDNKVEKNRSYGMNVKYDFTTVFEKLRSLKI